ncbi:B-cell receptor CD22-like isoform X1 [Melanotaenia boesemani]|uniref:B-cell receptor CD22-like isoform X1 n=2 Tax=Melanotaenia boesemani TaxID=1250792 RepID=UPI001C05B9AF|nr:B-cell receptor CD22-like isoform X1 [Melanotaenia boesemani]XP_041844836.1 B-cell receptor CD22-like isoform X1 [Melanotaenia boesemani]
MRAFEWPLFFTCICFKVIETKASSWTAQLPSSVKGLPGSCVVIPCSYNYPDTKNTISEYIEIWWDQKGNIIFHSKEAKIHQRYQSRVKLVGDPRQKNCSLKIEPLKADDTGPFYFRIEIKGYDSYSFKDKVFISMIHKPNPISFSVKEELKVGQSVSAACSVLHSCPASPPLFNWSHTGELHFQSQQVGDGQWNNTSTLTFRPTHTDNNKPLQCNVTYNGGYKERESKTLKVKYAPVNLKVEYKSDIKEGETVNLTCTGDANPPVNSYEWHNENNGKHCQGNLCILPNVSRHTGPMYCIAINEEGQTKSSPVQLNVLYAPVNVKIEYKSDIKEGETVNLTCTGDANPPVNSYEWHNENNGKHCQGNLCILPNVSRHTGPMYCIAINEEGQAKSSPVQLNVLYVPEIKTESLCSLEHKDSTLIKCECIVDSKPSSEVRFLLADKVLLGAKEEKNGYFTISVPVAELQSSTFVQCVANNTQGRANLTLRLPTDGMMLIIFISTGAGMIVVILLVAVGIVIKCRRKSADTQELNSTKMTERALELPRYETTTRKEMSDDDPCSGIYANVDPYDNGDWDDAIYGNV